MLSAVCLATWMPHIHQSSKVSSTSPDNLQAYLTVPSRIHLALTELLTMKYINRYPQATSNTRRYKMASLLLKPVEKTMPTIPSARLPVSYSVFFSCHQLAIQNSTSLCSALKIIQGPHLILGHQNGPLDLIHTTKTGLPSLRRTNYHL